MRARCVCARPKAISAAARRRFPAVSCSTASTCCAAPSCAWTTTRSTPWRARCWAKARPSRATCAIASARSCTTTATTCPRSRSTRAPTRGSRTTSCSKLNLVPLAFARSRLTGMTPDRVAASIASFDFLYLSELEPLRHRGAQRARRRFARLRGAAGRTRTRARHRPAPQRLGVRLQEPVSRASSAPSTSIRCRTSRRRRRGADLIETPGGAFRREPAILPRMLDELFPRREAARQAGDEVASHAIKILMNSFYGVLGTPACRFYNPALANSITGIGTRDPVVVEALVRGGRLRGAVRRHGQPVRADADDDPESGPRRGATDSPRR